MELHFMHINAVNVIVSLLQVKEILKLKILMVYYIVLNVDIIYLKMILLTIKK